jgi:hypothetical protein
MSEMKQRNLLVYLPLFLFLALFAIDKIALIPAFRECCTLSGTSTAFRAAIESDFRQDQMIAAARAEGRRLSMNFGSSRSLGYYLSPTRTHVAADRFLTPAEKNLVNSWEIVNSAAPGSSILYAYVRMTQWLDHGVRPEVIFVEFSPVAVTSNTQWFVTELKFGVPLNFTLKHLGKMPYAHVKTILGSRIFQLSRFRIGEPQAATPFLELVVREYADTIVIRPEHAPFSASHRAGQEPPATQLLFTRMTGIMAAGLFSGYRMDPSLLRYVDLMIERARAENIPIVFWRPPAHPMWAQVLKQRLDPWAWQRLVKHMRASGAGYVDLSEPGAVRCDYFMDPVHFGEHCVAEVFARKLQYYENQFVQ